MPHREGTSGPRRRVYIIADLEDEHRVREAFARFNGLDITSLSSAPPSTADSVADVGIDNILRCDFVVAVRPWQNPNRSFELGLAYAKRKPIVLIDPNASAPTEFRPADHIRLETDKIDAISERLKIFIQHYSSDQGTHYKRAGQGSKHVTKTPKTEPPQHASHFELLVHDLLATHASQLVSNTRKAGFDFSAWVDDIDPRIGNPIIVEAKTRLSPDDYKRVEQQMRQASIRDLFLITAEPQPEMHVSKDARIILIQFDDLQNELMHAPLKDVFYRHWASTGSATKS